VVEKNTLANHSRWMDFNAGEKPRDMGDETSQPIKTCLPTSMGYAVKQQGMQAGVTGQDFKPTPGGGVTVEDGLGVGADS
jgi:hypothetical protein